MIVDDIIEVLNSGRHTSTQIAMAINSSQGRVHNLLLELYANGIVDRAEIIDTAPYNKTRIYYVWYLLSSDSSTVEQ